MPSDPIDLTIKLMEIDSTSGREGDVIAWDGDQAVRAPYDNCVLIMPVPNNVKTGLTAVRLGRVEPR